MRQHQKSQKKLEDFKRAQIVKDQRFNLVKKKDLIELEKKKNEEKLEIEAEERRNLTSIWKKETKIDQQNKVKRTNFEKEKKKLNLERKRFHIYRKLFLKRKKVREINLDILNSKFFFFYQNYIFPFENLITKFWSGLLAYQFIIIAKRK